MKTRRYYWLLLVLFCAVTVGCRDDPVSVPSVQDLSWLLDNTILSHGDPAQVQGLLQQASAQQRADLHYFYHHGRDLLNPPQRLQVALAYWRLSGDPTAWENYDKVVQKLSDVLTSGEYQLSPPEDSVGFVHNNLRGGPMEFFDTFLIAGDESFAFKRQRVIYALATAPTRSHTTIAGYVVGYYFSDFPFSELIIDEIPQYMLEYATTAMYFNQRVGDKAAADALSFHGLIAGVQSRSPQNRPANILAIAYGNLLLCLDRGVTDPYRIYDYMRTAANYFHPDDLDPHDAAWLLEQIKNPEIRAFIQGLPITPVKYERPKLNLDRMIMTREDQEQTQGSSEDQ